MVITTHFHGLYWFVYLTCLQLCIDIFQSKRHNTGSNKPVTQLMFNSKPLVTLISALLFVSLGLACAQVFWQAYGYWKLAPSPTMALPNQTSSIANNTPHYTDYANDIGGAYLFGRPVAGASNNRITITELPDSQLKVTIKGILALADKETSFAILSIENAADKVFKVGSQVKDGHYIDQIIATGVVINHNGKLTMIRLPRAGLADITHTKGQANAASGVGLGKLRSEILTNPLALEQHIVFVPYTNNGQFAGYRVNAGSKPNMFRKLGLQADDIVASIDGVGIGQLAGRMDILTNLSVAKSIRLGIIRNGQQQQLLVDFSQ